MPRKPRITLFGTKKCPWTEKVQHFLEEQGYPDVSVSCVIADAAARAELFILTGQRSTPVVVIDGTVIIGYNPDEMRKALV